MGIQAQCIGESKLCWNRQRWGGVFQRLACVVWVLVLVCVYVRVRVCAHVSVCVCTVYTFLCVMCLMDREQNTASRNEQKIKSIYQMLFLR